MTKQFEFSPETVGKINCQCYDHLVPLVQRRMDVIQFTTPGTSHKEIAEGTGVTKGTLRDYFELYGQGGIEKLNEIHYYQPESDWKALPLATRKG